MVNVLKIHEALESTINQKEMALTSNNKIGNIIVIKINGVLSWMEEQG